MSALALTASDTLVLASRNLHADPAPARPAGRLTIQPVMFVLLFVYVFGGAIQTPGFDYVDFLMPGIIAQYDRLRRLRDRARASPTTSSKGLIDRFRSLPMARSAVLAGRTLSDIAAQLPVARVLFTSASSSGSTSRPTRWRDRRWASCCCC